MDSQEYVEHITVALEQAVLEARPDESGEVASYIPELLNVNHDYLSAAIQLSDGTLLTAGDSADYSFTIQSVSKLVVLIGLMEEFGEEQLFSWINAEPSGQSYASFSQLERFGPIPSNPLVNAGAIALCSHIPGDEHDRAAWVHRWMARLFGAELQPNWAVFASERETGDRNRSLAYLMKSNRVLEGDVESVLNTYFMACSYEANIKQAAYLPTLLSNGGLTPDGTAVFSERTSNAVVAIMATCGLYNESGMNLVQTGMPAKNGVSGLIVAVATGRGGIAVLSPRLSPKGSSVRGRLVIQHISKTLDWHFAAPWGYARLDSDLHAMP